MTNPEADDLKISIPSSYDAMEQVASHVGKMECYTCHAAWVPTCYGCHVDIDLGPEDLVIDHDRGRVLFLGHALRGGRQGLRVHARGLEHRARVGRLAVRLPTLQRDLQRLDGAVLEVQPRPRLLAQVDEGPAQGTGDQETGQAAEGGHRQAGQDDPSGHPAQHEIEVLQGLGGTQHEPVLVGPGRDIDVENEGVPGQTVEAAELVFEELIAGAGGLAYIAVYAFDSTISWVWASFIVGGVVSNAVAFLWIREHLWRRDPTERAIAGISAKPG